MIQLACMGVPLLFNLLFKFIIQEKIFPNTLRMSYRHATNTTDDWSVLLFCFRLTDENKKHHDLTLKKWTIF